LISDSLRRNSSNPAWLDAKARADLLDGHYSAAIKSLQLALSAKADSPELLTDLGSAYFQETNYRDAVESLGKALAQSPDNPVALFNRALAYEKLPAPDEAILDWGRYLTLDKNSEWASEARRHLYDLKQKIERKGAALPPLLRASEIVLLNDNEKIQHILDSRIEEYLDIALKEWLPAAFSTTDLELNAVQIVSSSEWQALEILARLLDQKHNDPWLRDFMESLKRDLPGRQALGSLSQAITLNAAGQYPQAKRAAHNAEQQFRDGAEAGWLRARIEDVYAFHFLQEGQVCFSEANGLLKNLERGSYAWIQIQTYLETAICANMTGRMREAKKATSRAIELAQSHNFPVLYLRGTALMAVLDWTSGNSSSATKIASDALEKFWSGEFPAMRGYSLYTVLDSIAEDSEQWFAQVSVVSEAVSLLENDPDHALQAVEYQRLGKAALHSGQLQLAEKAFQESTKQFSKAPEKGTEILRAANEIGLAGVESLRGNFGSAAERLQNVEPWVKKTSNRFIILDFYLTQADVLAGSGKPELARNASLQAVAIAEEGLSTIDGERNRLLWVREYDRAYRTLIKLKLYEDPIEAFEWWEWYKGAPLRSQEPGDSGQATPSLDRPFPVSISEKAPKHPPKIPTPDDFVLLSYIVLPEQIGAWFKDSSKIEFRELPISLEDLLQLSRHFAEHCADRNADIGEITEEEHRLYDVLIQPFSSLIIGHHHILIEADGILDAIAFEPLIDHEGRVFGEDHDIAMSPGITYLSRLRRGIGPADYRNTLVVGNPSYEHKDSVPLDEIPSADREARQIAEMIPNSRLLTGSNATSSAILAAIQHANIFHFAGHAVATPDGSALLLGTPAELDADLLDAVRIEKTSVERTKLAVLSACSSAGNGSQTLSESSSLARAFLAAGVSQVIASRWSVDSDATMELMDHFYRHLLAGSSVSDALRFARTEMRTVYKRPYYWAAFSIFGQV
jgi:CHAT domain-containing protein/Tfp pilus assembly protein PilF